MNKKINYLAVALVLMLGCTKEELTTINYPITKTVSLMVHSNEGVTFHGEIAYSTVEIIDHGFIWSETADPHEGNYQKVSLGQKTGIGVFEARSDRGFKYGKSYFVRAYAKTAEHTVYGNRIGFTSSGCKLPVIKSFFPSEATWGDTITIVGENFSDENEHNIVRFGQFRGTVVKSGRDTVMVKVPMELTELWSSIALTFEENRTPAMNWFTLKRPIIESVTPNEAPSGTTVLIKGKYLMSYANEVTFGGTKALLTNRSPEVIECVVPSRPSGSVTLQLTTGTNLTVTSFFKIAL